MSVWPLFLPCSSFHLLPGLSPAAQRCPLLPRFGALLFPHRQEISTRGKKEKEARVDAVPDYRTDMAPGGRC